MKLIEILKTIYGSTLVLLIILQVFYIILYAFVPEIQQKDLLMAKSKGKRLHSWSLIQLLMPIYNIYTAKQILFLSFCSYEQLEQIIKEGE